MFVLGCLMAYGHGQIQCDSSPNQGRNMTTSSRQTPLGINQWLKDIGRRALVMAELATNFHHHSQDIVQDSLLAFIKHYATNRPSNGRCYFMEYYVIKLQTGSVNKRVVVNG